jgi:Domain of unknown function (DUF4159)/Prenyltransferase and squalene oxidase repeat
MTLRTATLMTLTVALLFGVAAPTAWAVTDEQVDKAIAKAIEHIFSYQEADGKFSPSGNYMWVKYSYRYGHEAIAMMALAHAKVPLKDERMRKGLDFLLKAPLEHTYTRACRVITIARLMPQLGREEKPGIVKVAQQDIKWLIEKQISQGQDEGMWSYPTKPNSNVDFSNTQFAILALHEFELAGGELPNEPYLKAQKAFLERQKEDGGWNYGWMHPRFRVHPSTTGMTAVGVASLYIIRDKLYLDRVCPCRGGRSGKRPPQIDAAILRGIRWLGDNYKAKTGSGHNLYMHYACARVGLAAGLKYFGSHDWYREGSEHIVRRQDKDGSWSTHKRLDRSCFAMMFLLKGRAPILLNKLQFDGKWDMHPRDASHLAKWVGRIKEQEMAWQVIGFDAPVPEWHDAPILYISAESAPKLTDEHKRKLRQYTDTGGTILFEASCGNAQVNSWWKKTCGEIWPEWELKRLEKTHPLWTADLQIKGRLPQFQGIYDGTRTLVIYSPKDISCLWHSYAITRNKNFFDLGANLYAYATDRGRLRGKLSRVRITMRDAHRNVTPNPGGRDTLRIRFLKHGGDWYINRHAKPLATLAKALTDKGGHITLTVGEAATASSDEAGQTDVFWLTGRKNVTLSAGEAAALKTWLAGGGYLVADACMGEAVFDRSFRALAKQIGLTVKKVGRDGGLVTGSLAGAGGYNLGKVDFTHALRTERVGRFHAELSGLYLDGKLVGVYSPFDVSLTLTGVKAFGCRGYAAGDAQAVATNMLLPATTMAAGDEK